jgi:hypothetical protein
MSIYPEISTALTKEIGGKSYLVRSYGLNGIVLEEELYPLSANKTIRIMKADGTEDVTKRKTEKI